MASAVAIFVFKMHKKLVLLGSGELGKEICIAAQRLGCEVIACDRYVGAPAMQVADYSEVLNMNDEKALKKTKKLPYHIYQHKDTLSFKRWF